MHDKDFNILCLHFFINKSFFLGTVGFLGILHVRACKLMNLIVSKSVWGLAHDRDDYAARAYLGCVFLFRIHSRKESHAYEEPTLRIVLNKARSK